MRAVACAAAVVLLAGRSFAQTVAADDFTTHADNTKTECEPPRFDFRREARASARSAQMRVHRLQAALRLRAHRLVRHAQTRGGLAREPLRIGAHRLEGEVVRDRAEPRAELARVRWTPS